MNPFWKKAYYDVTSKEDLEKWYEVENALKQKPILTFFHDLVETDVPPPDFVKLAALFEESWGDPQMDEDFLDDSWELTTDNFMDKISDKINNNSMNQVIDSDLDFSADKENFINLNDLLSKRY